LIAGIKSLWEHDIDTVTNTHQVNNYWYQNSGHAFEIGQGGYVLAEGNVFQNIVAAAESPIAGQLFSSPDTNTNAVCSNYIGRACQLNGYGSSGALSQADTAFLTNFGGKNIASASAYTSVVASVNANAGQGKL
jgi:pectin lyase